MAITAVGQPGMHVHGEYWLKVVYLYCSHKRITQVQSAHGCPSMECHVAKNTIQLPNN